ncbi:MAG: Asp23/Gls24 family envelope stress response protein [Chloroflexota bacterium]|nr:MAG: hypothetical protein DIU80_02950 [Chloroflexota bacterium]
MAQPSENMTVAPHVLIDLISAAVRAVPGVARLGTVPHGREGVLRDRRVGFDLRTDPEGVSVDCYLVALPDTSLLEVGVAVQASVAAVLRELLGVAVREVNVSIQDVGAHSPAGDRTKHG